MFGTVVAFRVKLQSFAVLLLCLCTIIPISLVPKIVSHETLPFVRNIQSSMAPRLVNGVHCKNTVIPKTFWVPEDESINQFIAPKLQSLGWTQVIDVNNSVTFLWTRGISQFSKAIHQHYNTTTMYQTPPPEECMKDRIKNFDLRGLGFIGNKGLLPGTLKNFTRDTGVETMQLVPRTHGMFELKEAEEFFKMLPCNKTNVKHRSKSRFAQIWIIKNVWKSQGKKIKLIADPKKIREFFRIPQDYCGDEVKGRDFPLPEHLPKKHPQDDLPDTPLGDFVVQEYIMNPLLYHKRKFHIRPYILVASGDPLLVLYFDSYAMVSALEYNLQSLNPKKHLTNARLSKKVREKMDGDTPDLESYISLQELQSHLIEAYPDIPSDYFKETMVSQMKDTIRTAFLAAELGMKRELSDGKDFSLLAADFLVTEDCRVILLEFQLGPQHGYQYTNNWGPVFAQELASETIDIVLEAHDRIEKHQTFQGIAVKKFDVVLDRSSDRREMKGSD